MESEKCELAKEEKEQLGTKETAESLLALVDESADEQGLTATRLKIQTGKRHFPPRQAKPSKMTVYEVLRSMVTFQLLSLSCKKFKPSPENGRGSIFWIQQRARDPVLQKKSLLWLECVYVCLQSMGKGCMLHKIKEATTDPPSLSLCQKQLTGCLAVTLDINQSSDLVQWSASKTASKW